MRVQGRVGYYQIPVISRVWNEVVPGAGSKVAKRPFSRPRLICGWKFLPPTWPFFLPVGRFSHFSFSLWPFFGLPFFLFLFIDIHWLRGPIHLDALSGVSLAAFSTFNGRRRRGNGK
jgi:hypothetical protein